MLWLEKDAREDWSDELYAEATRELPAELTITYCDRNGQIKLFVAADRLRRRLNSGH